MNSKNEFKLSYGIFSNVINSKINIKNLNTISEIDLYVENNKSNSFILQIENNPREIYKIAKNHSFIKWILSEDVIIKSKKYLFDSKYWIKLFELVFELLPFKIDEKDKKIEIIYDENNFQVREIKCKLINSFTSYYNNKKYFFLDDLVNDKLLKSKVKNVESIMEKMIFNNFINLKYLSKNYVLDPNKLKNCSINILSEIMKLGTGFENLINIEIISKKIKLDVSKLAKLLKFQNNIINNSFIVMKNNEIDIFSSARAIRSFIEFISKILIIDQILKCYKSTKKEKFNKKIRKLSELLNIEISKNLLNISINFNDSNFDATILEIIRANANLFEILHLKYHLENFNNEFCFDNSDYGFTKEVYEFFIQKVISIFDRQILNVFTHSFDFFDNLYFIDKYISDFLKSLNEFILLAETEYYSKFIIELNELLELLKNRNNSLIHFFNMR